MELEQALLRSISLDTFIPENGKAPLSELLEDDASSEEHSHKGILDIKRRDIVFIDEKVRVAAVLQVPQCEEDVLKLLLSQAEFKIEVWAFDRATQDERTRSLVEPAKDLVYATTVPKLDDPIVLAQQKNEDVAETVFVLIWELEITLHRPRFRMQDPLIAIHSALLVSRSDSGNEKPKNLLEPFRLQEPNVFESMRNMPGLDGKAPYLAASRLDRVRPETPKSAKQFRVEHVSSSYRMVAVAVTRIKYTRPSTPATLPMLIASLDIEIIPIFEVAVVIETADLTMLNGKVRSLMPKILPMECRSRDLISLLFRLQASSNLQQAASPVTPGSIANVDVLSLSLALMVKVSETCRPAIRMTWTTNVDFFQTLNPSFGAPSQPIQRDHKPSSLALQNGNGFRQASQSISTSLQAVYNTATASQVTISFTAPDSPIEIGKPFSWTMLVINNSPKPTKLAIIPLPRIPRGSNQTAHFAKRHAPKSSTASFQPAERRHTRDNEASDIDFAQAVVDENVVYAMQHSNITPSGTDLMAITAEVRVGLLAPGQCHEGAIEMVAFIAGTLRVDAIRVIDLIREAEEGVSAPGVMIDIRDLPDVIVANTIDE